MDAALYHWTSSHLEREDDDKDKDKDKKKKKKQRPTKIPSRHSADHFCQLGADRPLVCQRLKKIAARRRRRFAPKRKNSPRD